MNFANIAKNTQHANMGYSFLLQKSQPSYPHEVTENLIV